MGNITSHSALLYASFLKDSPITDHKMVHAVNATRRIDGAFDEHTSRILSHSIERVQIDEYAAFRHNNSILVFMAAVNARRLWGFDDK